MTIASTSLAAALWDEYGRIDANRHNLSLICVQLKLVAIHSEQNIINTRLNTRLNRKELIGWGTFGHSVWHSLCCGFACKRTERFQDYCQTDFFLKLNQDTFLKNL